MVKKAADTQLAQDPTDQDRLDLAKRRRRGRVLWLTVARRTLAALGVFIVLGWERKPPPFITSLAKVVRESVNEIPLVGTLLGGTNETTVNVLSVIVALVFAYYTLYLVWVWWEKADVSRLIARNDFRLIEMPFLVFLVSFSCIVVLPVMFMVTEWLGQDYFYAFVIVGGVMTMVVVSDHFLNTQITERLIISSAAGPIEKAIKRTENFERAELTRGVNSGSQLAAYRLGRWLESEGEDSELRSWLKSKGKDSEANKLYEKAFEFDSHGR